MGGSHTGWRKRRRKGRKTRGKGEKGEGGGWIQRTRYLSEKLVLGKECYSMAG
jgi:hypothetical protein